MIAASLSLADIPGTVRLWRQRRVEFLLSITAFLGVALLGVLQGIAVAVALSILNVFRRAWWPYQTTLGRVPGMPGQHDRELHPEAEELPGLVIFRFDAPLFFANARTFRDQIRRLAAAEPRPHWILIAAEPITDVDTTAADMLADLDEELNAAGTFLVFAELKDPVRDEARALRADRPAQSRSLLPHPRRRSRHLLSKDRRSLDVDHRHERVTVSPRQQGLRRQRPCAAPLTRASPITAPDPPASTVRPPPGDPTSPPWKSRVGVSLGVRLGHKLVMALVGQLDFGDDYPRL